MEREAGKPLLVVGASARAACESARRRGRVPAAIDLFGDLDLRTAAARWARIEAERYPAGLPEAAAAFPSAPFLTTGGLENHPDVVARLESTRANEGTAAAALRRVRDPLFLAELWRSHGIAAPRVWPSSGVPPGTGDAGATRWLRKPLRGSGGAGIEIWNGATNRATDRSTYLQQRLEGTPCSAVYEADGRGGVELLGVSLQLVGIETLGARPFAYCGSVGPLSIEASVQRRFCRIGEALATVPLRGLFGVDVVLADDVPYPVEVNPRYPASLEIHERAAERGVGGDPFLGKAILFARGPVEFPGAEPLRDAIAADLEDLADVPPRGTPIAAGRPVLTFFTSGASVSCCRSRIESVAREIFERLLHG